MSESTRRGLSLALALCLLVRGPVAALGEPRDGSWPDPREVLSSAFENRYGLSSRQVIHIVMRNRVGDESRRKVAVATKTIEGRLHSLGRFLEPEYLRGTTILNIENEGRGDDHFLYLRSLQRIRRVSVSHRSDAFMGTDLTYEDFERRRVDDYDLEARPAAQLLGEAVHVIAGRPRFGSAYAHVEFYIAKSDQSILEVRYFKAGAKEPFKVLSAPRAAIRSVAGHWLPTLLIVENRTRGTRTEVRIEDIELDPKLDDALFTASSIEIGRPIPGLE